jgi:plastocyanin
MTMGWVWRVGLAALVVTTVSCGGGDSSSPSSPSSPSATCGSDGKTIVIANNTVCPSTLTVAIGTQVTFVNNDARSHNMVSDPHPEHTDCPELNQVGFLTSGQSRQTGNLVTARTCGFHDHDNFEITTLQGSITIR